MAARPPRDLARVHFHKAVLKEVLKVAPKVDVQDALVQAMEMMDAESVSKLCTIKPEITWFNACANKIRHSTLHRKARVDSVDLEVILARATKVGTAVQVASLVVQVASPVVQVASLVVQVASLVVQVASLVVQVASLVVQVVFQADHLVVSNTY